MVWKYGTKSGKSGHHTDVSNATWESEWYSQQRVAHSLEPGSTEKEVDEAELGRLVLEWIRHHKHVSKAQLLESMPDHMMKTLQSLLDRLDDDDVVVWDTEGGTDKWNVAGVRFGSGDTFVHEPPNTPQVPGTIAHDLLTDEALGNVRDMMNSNALLLVSWGNHEEAWAKRTGITVPHLDMLAVMQQHIIPHVGQKWQDGTAKTGHYLGCCGMNILVKIFGIRDCCYHKALSDSQDERLLIRALLRAIKTLYFP